MRNQFPKNPTHPGFVLKEELKARGIKQNAFATNLNISTTILNEILNEKRRISIPIALKLEKELEINAEVWLNLQKNYDKAINYHKNKKELEKLRLSPVRKHSILELLAK